MSKRVTIRHEDGREYSIEAADFTSPKVSPSRQSYADQGFRIVSHEDGSPYDGPTSKAEIEAANRPAPPAEDSARNVQPTKPTRQAKPGGEDRADGAAAEN